ncbi:GSU2403 family nucleotidyltransferase fold protein [Variovorax atrisoli]|uniref:GSU2403 family nucleotidyltransferase fold protein n=1 Tax=Variovorax atrisoli TaxID=3394203 RepID=UPI003394B6D3
MIRTSSRGTHKSLGPKSHETQRIYASFTERKAQIAQRLAAIEATFDEQRRLNRVLRVGRAPTVVIDALNALDAARLAEHFVVVSTHSLYAYEGICGVRFTPSAVATHDIYPLFDTCRRLAFFSRMKESEASFVGLPKKADKTFERLEDRKETVRNATGFEVDVIRRTAKDGDPHPLRMSNDEDDVWAVQASTGDRILSAPRFSQMVVATNGAVAIMHTMAPPDFARIKRKLAEYPTRDPLKRSKDRIQAELVEELSATHMPQYVGS